MRQNLSSRAVTYPCLRIWYIGAPMRVFVERFVKHSHFSGSRAHSLTHTHTHTHTHMHAQTRQTDGQTDRQTDRQQRLEDTTLKGNSKKERAQMRETG